MLKYCQDFRNNLYITLKGQETGVLQASVMTDQNSIMCERDCRACKEDDIQVDKVQRTSLSGRKNKENDTVFKVKKKLRNSIIF